jgi:hypothetical protein
MGDFGIPWDLDDAAPSRRLDELQGAEREQAVAALDVKRRVRMQLAAERDEKVREALSLIKDVELVAGSAVWMCGRDEPGEPLQCWSMIAMDDVDDSISEAVKVLEGAKNPPQELVSVLGQLQAIREQGHAPCTDDECFAYDMANRLVGVCRTVIEPRPPRH